MIAEPRALAVPVPETNRLQRAGGVKIPSWIVSHCHYLLVNHDIAS